MSDVDRLLGQRVRQRRTELKMSTRTLADRMRDHGHDWQHNTVLRTQNGVRPLRVSEAFSVAAVLQTPVAYVLGLAEGQDDAHAELHGAARRQLGYELQDSIRKGDVPRSVVHWRGDEIPLHTTDQVELWLSEYLSREDDS